jgi:hypothetical protein
MFPELGLYALPLYFQGQPVPNFMVVPSYTLLLSLACLSLPTYSGKFFQGRDLVPNAWHIIGIKYLLKKGKKLCFKNS